eukprot:7390831-Prymnesium_polylepis.1
MQPMDTSEAADGVAIDPEVVCAPVEGAASTEDLVLDDAECWPEADPNILDENTDAQTYGARVADLEATKQ